MTLTISVDGVQRADSDEAARLRRATAIDEIRRTFEGIRERILAQRDQSWHEAVESSARRLSAALEGIEVAADGSLNGKARAVVRARAALEAEFQRMPFILGAIQTRAETTWADAIRVRERRIAAFNFGLDRGAA